MADTLEHHPLLHHHSPHTHRIRRHNHHLHTRHRRTLQNHPHIHPNRPRMCRITGLEGEQLGIVSLREALEKAEEAGVDLVEISPNAEPPRHLSYHGLRQVPL